MGMCPHWTFFKQALNISSSWQLGPSETWLFACLPHFTQGSFSPCFSNSASPALRHHFLLCFMICSVSEGHLPTGLLLSLENCIVTLCIRDLMGEHRDPVVQ